MIGRKKGMTQIFDASGRAIACTALLVEPNVVAQIKTQEKDGYSALQLAAIKVKDSKKRKVKKPLQGHYAAASIEPHKKLLEWRLDDPADFKVGDTFGVDVFAEGDVVDTIATSKGKGFQGVMKRHGFKGGPASHGSGFHRAAGSTGMRSTPGRCLPGGVRMAGQMGNRRVTVEGLLVIGVDVENNLLLVKGAVPGPKEGIVIIRHAMKKSLQR